MALKVPAHRVDAPAVYVCADDDAWLDAASDAAKEWRQGVGRFDPDLLAPLIDESKQPTKWSMVRPSHREYLRLENVRASAGYTAAFFEAARVCLRGVNGYTCKSWEAGKEATPEEFAALDCWAGRQLLLEVGGACWFLSADLTEAEKKP